MTAYAQEWADKLAREDGFEHRQNNTYGENLYSSWSSNPKAKVICRLIFESFSFWNLICYFMDTTPHFRLLETLLWTVGTPR